MDAGMGLGIVQLVIIFVVMIALYLFPIWKIFGKTGMSPYLSLLIFVPGIGFLICILILAFADWPDVDGQY